jgi:hypothetical protein
MIIKIGSSLGTKPYSPTRQNENEKIGSLLGTKPYSPTRQNENEKIGSLLGTKPYSPTRLNENEKSVYCWVLNLIRQLAKMKMKKSVQLMSLLYGYLTYVSYHSSVTGTFSARHGRSCLVSSCQSQEGQLIAMKMIALPIA